MDYLKSIVSKQIRLRHPEYFEIGAGSVVDDFCYFSTRVRIGRFCHLANGVSIAGGQERQFDLGDYSSLSAGVKVWCSSDDFKRDMIMLIPTGLPQIKENLITGDVRLGRLTGVGANSVIMPDNDIPEGVAIGALSFVPPRFDFKPWSVYAGVPLRHVGSRDKESVLRQLARFQAALSSSGLEE